MIVKTLTLAMTALAASALGAGAASAAVTRIAAENFNDTAGFIGFEDASPLVNPPYTTGGVTVNFDSWFIGQSSVVCPFTPTTACLSGTPAPGLALQPVSPGTSVWREPTFGSAALGGDNPTHNSPGTGPISILFSEDQLAVGFDAGWFDAAGSTLISAFDRDGALLGTITNTGTGIEFLGFATTDGLARIAGVQLSLIGDEPNGFAIDNLRFGVAGQVEVPGAVPEPAAWVMMIMGFGLIGAAMRREAGRRRAVSGQARKG